MTITKENVRPFIDAMNRTLEKLTFSGKTVQFRLNERGDKLVLEINAEPKGYYNCLSHSTVTMSLDHSDIDVNIKSLDEIEKRIMCNFIYAGDNDIIICAVPQDLRHCIELRVTQWSIDFLTDSLIDGGMELTSYVTIAEKSQEEEV